MSAVIGIALVGWPELPASPTIRSDAVSKSSTPVSCTRSQFTIAKHHAFYGVQAKAKKGVTADRFNALIPKDDDQRWCVLSFVVDVGNSPVTLQIAYYYKANREDEELNARLLRSSGLFTKVVVLKSPRWIPPG
jgi:hypothetical protein